MKVPIEFWVCMKSQPAHQTLPRVLKTKGIKNCALHITMQCNAPINGAARITKLASPAPTEVRKKRRLQKFHARPEENTEMNQISNPMPTSLKVCTVFARCTKIGHATNRPTMNAAGKHPSWKLVREKAPCSVHLYCFCDGPVRLFACAASSCHERANRVRSSNYSVHCANCKQNHTVNIHMTHHMIHDTRQQVLRAGPLSASCPFHTTNPCLPDPGHCSSCCGG
jgi:hypothetical protein